MKYIIDIEDEPFVRKSCLYGEEALYRAKGFKSLVFDQTGLDKLTPYEEAHKRPASELSPGDEVIFLDGTKAVALDSDQEGGGFWFLTENGCIEYMNEPLSITGHKYTEIENMLKRMRNK